MDVAYVVVRYYRIVQIFGQEIVQLEDTSEPITREAFEKLKLENKNVDFLMR